jgi:electron transfer flavoprotein alpha subunit
MVSGKRNKRILIVADQDDDKSISPITLELLRAGRDIANKTGWILCAATLGNQAPEQAHEIALFCDEVYRVDCITLASYQSDLCADALADLCGSVQPEVLLLGHTADILDLAPKLGYRIGSHLITDCVEVDVDPSGGCLLCKKPIYGDAAVATFVNDKKPWMATLRPNSLEPAEQEDTAGKIIVFNPNIECSLAKTELIETQPGQGVDLAKADAVVAGGRGIGGAENLKYLEDLAEALRRRYDIVEVGASRPLVDSGWLPPFRQVGLTGVKVKPRLYIAVGISGSLQHLSGFFGANRIVAINSDPEASIFNYADIGVVGGYEMVLPSLVAELRDLR